MNAAENPQIEELLNASARDERTLHFDVDDEIFGFHAQQAVEKLLKALLTIHGERHPFIHDIQKLLDQLNELGERLGPWVLSPNELTEYAADFRYSRGPVLESGVREGLRGDIASLRAYVVKRREELRIAGVQVRQP